MKVFFAIFVSSFYFSFASAEQFNVVVLCNETGPALQGTLKFPTEKDSWYFGPRKFSFNRPCVLNTNMPQVELAVNNHVYSARIEDLETDMPVGVTQCSDAKVDQLPKGLHDEFIFYVEVNDQFGFSGYLMFGSKSPDHFIDTFEFRNHDNTSCSITKMK